MLDLARITAAALREDQRELRRMLVDEVPGLAPMVSELATFDRTFIHAFLVTACDADFAQIWPRFAEAVLADEVKPCMKSATDQQLYERVYQRYHRRRYLPLSPDKGSYAASFVASVATGLPMRALAYAAMAGEASPRLIQVTNQRSLLAPPAHHDHDPQGILKRLCQRLLAATRESCP